MVVELLTSLLMCCVSRVSVLFDDSPFCMAQKSHFLKTLVYQLFSVVPFGVAKKMRRTQKVVKFLKVVLSIGRQGKSALFSLTT